MRFIDASDAQKAAIWNKHHEAQRAAVRKNVAKYERLAVRLTSELEQLENVRECSCAAIGLGQERRESRLVAEKRAELAVVRNTMKDAGI